MNEKKLLLLGLLRGQDMHGYKLFETIEDNLAACTGLKKPTAYYLLNQLAEEGWIAEEEKREGNRPPRKVYRLTQTGEDAFQRLLRENIARYTPPVFAETIGLAFLDSISDLEALLLLEQRRQALNRAIIELNAVPHHGSSAQFILDHQKAHLSSELSWLDALIDKFKGKLTLASNYPDHEGAY